MKLVEDDDVGSVQRGSSMSMRVMMPSVRTSIRVVSDTFVSNLTLYPTVFPTGSPIVAAMRAAICMAASLRGSSMIIFPPPLAFMLSRMVSGRTVDFPAPGGAVTMVVGCVEMASFSLPAIS